MTSLFKGVIDASSEYPKVQQHFIDKLEKGYKGEKGDWSAEMYHIDIFLNKLIIEKHEGAERSIKRDGMLSELNYLRTLLGKVECETDIEPWLDEFKSEIVPILNNFW